MAGDCSKRTFLKYLSATTALASAGSVSTILGCDVFEDSCFVPLGHPELEKKYGGLSLLEKSQLRSSDLRAPAKVRTRSLRPNAVDPNIFFILGDSWRFDHFSETSSPNLWNLSESGLCFQRHFVNAGQTLPSFTSMASGRSPVFRERGPMDVTGFDYLKGREWSSKRRGIPSSLDTFFNIVKNSSRYFVASYTQNPKTGHESGYWYKHWDFYGEPKHVLGDGGGANLNLFALREIRKIQSNNPGVPLLAHFHFMDTHYPYDLGSCAKVEHEEQVQFFNTWGDEHTSLTDGNRATRTRLMGKVRALYQNGVRAFDRFASRLVEELMSASAQHGRDCVCLISSDHGEMLNEESEISWYVGHDGHLPQVIAHVPLIIVGRVRGEKIAPRKIDGITDGLDIAPTILTLAGTKIPGSMTGKNLLETHGKDVSEAFSAFDRSRAEMVGSRILYTRTSYYR